MAMRFTTNDLREWMNALCVALEARGLARLDPAHDHYWHLDPAASFDLTREPAVTAGQISDDLEDLKFEIKSTHDPEALGHVIDWHFAGHLAGIIHYVAFVTAPPDDGPEKSDVSRGAA